MRKFEAVDGTNAFLLVAVGSGRASNMAFPDWAGAVVSAATEDPTRSGPLQHSLVTLPAGQAVKITYAVTVGSSVQNVTMYALSTTKGSYYVVSLVPPANAATYATQFSKVFQSFSIG